MMPTTADILETADVTDLPADDASSELFWRRFAKFTLLGIVVVLLSPVLLVLCMIPLTVACCLGVPLFGDSARTRF